MMQVTPHMRIWVAVEPVDFRSGIDGLGRICREALACDPFSGVVVVFRNRSATAIKALSYDGNGFWLCQHRLSRGRFRHWPSRDGSAKRELLAHELQVLLAGGNPAATHAPPRWRQLEPAALETAPRQVRASSVCL